MRFETGDEMSRRAKFAFITWIGPAVGALKKAAVSTDKAFVKELWPVRLSLLKFHCHFIHVFTFRTLVKKYWPMKRKKYNTIL